MKLIDRHAVEGTTSPVIYIGHRFYREKDGREHVGRTWTAEYCVHGRHYVEALRTPNKQAAIRRAHDIWRRIDDGQFAPRVFKLNSTELRDKYLEQVRNENRAPKTVEKYTFGLGQFDQWCIDTKRHSMVAFIDTDFWAYNGWMIEKGMSEKSRYDRLILVKQALKFAWKRKLIPEYTLGEAKINKPEPTEQPCFTPGQVAVLLACADQHEAAIFAVMAYTGMRVGEVRDLKWTDILFNAGRNGFICVKRGGSRKDKTKSGRHRRIPINPLLKPYLEKLPKTFDRVFTARPSKKYPEGGGPISERRLLLSLKRLCKRCEFDNPKQYKVHTFRHAFASMCACNNIAYKYALEWMGHSSSKILDIYYKMYDEVAELAMKSIVFTQPESDKAA